MQMLKAFKYRIYPTKSQAELFAKTFGCVRFVYNKMLADKIAHYELTSKTLAATPAMYKGEFPFLKEVDSLALCNAQLNLQVAYKNFFTRKDIHFPKFKKKRYDASYTTNMVNGNIAIAGGTLKLPKAGYVKIKLHRQLPVDAVIKSVTVKRTATGKYYASILAEWEADTPATVPIRKDKTIGLDYSSSHFYVDSEGDSCNYDKYYRKAEGRLAKAQRRLSKKKKGSKNYYKQRHRVAVIHEKTANQRLNFLHQQSALIAKEYDVACAEDINLKNISRGLRLGKSTMDNGFGMFRTLLKYKLAERGKHFVLVDKWYPSSKTCSDCGYLLKELGLSDRMYLCPECGLILDRDHNAAINIKKEGLRMLSA